MAHPGMDRHHRFTVLRPTDGLAVLDLPSVSGEHAELLRQLIGPHLAAGFIALLDGERVIAGTAPPSQAHPERSLPQVQQLTEMAVQQHEYLCAELRRMRQEYEDDFAQERAILRTLRQRWLERVCDDQVRGEDALRYVVEAARSAAKKGEPASGG